MERWTGERGEEKWKKRKKKRRQETRGEEGR